MTSVAVVFSAYLFLELSYWLQSHYVKGPDKSIVWLGVLKIIYTCRAMGSL